MQLLRVFSQLTTYVTTRVFEESLAAGKKLPGQLSSAMLCICDVEVHASPARQGRERRGRDLVSPSTINARSESATDIHGSNYYYSLKVLEQQFDISQTR